MNLFKCKEKWERAFSNLDATDEEKKVLYERYSSDLLKPIKDQIEFYKKKDKQYLINEILRLKKKLNEKDGFYVSE
jgi:ABC-type phosphate/phosphonate transport system substrate-binding protein